MGQINIRYNTAKEIIRQKSKLLNSYDQTMILMHRLTKDCYEDERNYQNQLHNREKDLELIQQNRKADKNSSGMRSTKNQTLDTNRLTNLKNNSNIDLNQSLSKYSTIKFVKGTEEDQESSSDEKDALKEKLLMENAI